MKSPSVCVGALLGGRELIQLLECVNIRLAVGVALHVRGPSHLLLDVFNSDRHVL